MAKLILNLNHVLFWWYYNRVGKHFHQWTFFKSVNLLIQNYEHTELLLKNECENYRAAMKESDALRKENSQLRIQQIATDGQIRWAKKSFGVDWVPPTEN